MVFARPLPEFGANNRKAPLSGERGGLHVLSKPGEAYVVLTRLRRHRVHTSALTGIPASMIVARRTFALKVRFFFGARRAHPAETLLEMVRPWAVPLLHKSHLVATD